jgi:hypothetical protein
MTKMYEIDFELIEDGSIRLEQQSGIDEPNMIWLHPEQLKFIARRMTGTNEATAVQVEELERRLLVLTAGLEEFVCDSSTRGEIPDDCRSGLEFITRLDGLLNLAWEFSGCRLTPEDMRRQQTEATGVPKDPPYAYASPIKNNATKRDNVEQLGLDV